MTLKGFSIEWVPFKDAEKKHVSHNQKAGNKMVVIPEPCKELRRRISARIYGWEYPLLTFIYPGFDCGPCGCGGPPIPIAYWCQSELRPTRPVRTNRVPLSAPNHGRSPKTPWARSSKAPLLAEDFRLPDQSDESCRLPSSLQGPASWGVMGVGVRFPTEHPNNQRL